MPKRELQRLGMSTYSIVGSDPAEGSCGVAVQSKFLAAGAVVPWARGGVGAIATQAFANVRYGPDGLDLLAEGRTPQETLDQLIAGDNGAQHRQIGIVGADGSRAAFTGSECFEFAAHATAENCTAQGNILTSPNVPDAMVDAFTAASGTLAQRLMRALAAGQEAGGEKRGMEAAALVVVKPGGGYGGNHDRWIDLRVDHADDPISQLNTLLDLHTLYFGTASEEDLIPIDPPLATELTTLLEASGWWSPTESLEDNLSSWIGWHNLEERWRGPDRIDPLVLRELRSTAD